MGVQTEVVLEEEDRLDRALAAAIPELSRRGAKKLIDGGAVFVDGKRCRVASRTVRPGTRVVLHHEPDPPQPQPYSVLYENDRMIVVNKHAGVHVNPTETSAKKSLVEYVGGHVVHRLDRDTTGVLMIAKDVEMAALLSTALRERRVEKRYLAVVVGSPKLGLIDQPIGIDPRRPQRQAVVPTGKPAETRVVSVEDHGDVSAAMLDLITGRTHQARVHLSFVGCPILGDLAYGSPKAARTTTGVARPDRPLLHALRLNVEVLGSVHEFEAPVPEDIRSVLP